MGPSNSNLNSGNYQQYAYRPSKLRSLNNKHIIGAQGVSGERIKLNQHASQEKLSNYSGNYGSPSRDNRDPNNGQQYVDQMHAQANQQLVQQHVNRRLAGSKIGQGALKKSTAMEPLRNRDNQLKPPDR